MFSVIIGTAVALEDVEALQDGLNTLTNVLIRAESRMRKTIAEHVQVCKGIHYWNLLDHGNFS